MNREEFKALLEEAFNMGYEDADECITESSPTRRKETRRILNKVLNGGGRFEKDGEHYYGDNHRLFINKKGKVWGDSDRDQTAHKYLKRLTIAAKNPHKPISDFERNLAQTAGTAFTGKDLDVGNNTDKYNKFIDKVRSKAKHESNDYESEYEELYAYDESLSKSYKREIQDSIEEMKKKGMSKKGISLNVRANVANDASRRGYYSKENKNPYISEKTADKYEEKFRQHLRNNRDDAEKFIKAKTRVDGGSYKKNRKQILDALGYATPFL